MASPRSYWDVCFLLLRLPTNVALASHLMGFGTGFVIALALAATGVIRPTRYEQTLVQIVQETFGR